MATSQPPHTSRYTLKNFGTLHSLLQLFVLDFIDSPLVLQHPSLENMQHFSPSQNTVTFKQDFYGTNEPAELILRIGSTETDKGSSRWGYNVYIWAQVKNSGGEVVKVDGEKLHLAWMINLEGWEDGYGEERRGLRGSWGWIVKVIRDVLSANFNAYGGKRGEEESRRLMSILGPLGVQQPGRMNFACVDRADV